jgi:hypothetical protein
MMRIANKVTIMNITSKVLGFVGASVIALSMITSASAGTTADVSVKVSAPDNATIAASITSGTISEVKYRAGSSFQNSTGAITVTATDTRGIGSGWTVTLAANGDFKDSTDSTRSCSVSNFPLQADTTQGKDSASVNGLSGSAVSTVSTSNQTILSATKGNGLGVFDSTMNATIRIPDNTLVGTYKTTLTVSITASN